MIRFVEMFQSVLADSVKQINILHITFCLNSKLKGLQQCKADKCSNVVTWWLCILPLASSARILFLVPHISKSHANFNDAITESLLEAGHHVTAFTSFPENIEHPNYTKVEVWRVERSRKTNFVPLNILLEKSNSWDLMNLLTNESLADCVRIIHVEKLQKVLKSPEKLFDVLIVDIMAYSFECFIPIADVLNIPVIGTVSMRSWRNMEWLMGNPYNPAVTPFDISYQSNKMTFTQRLRNTWDCIVDIWHYNNVITPKVNAFYRNYYPTVGSRKRLSLLFVNGHSILNPRPLLPTIVNIGGIHVPPEKPLPKNLQTFMDTADQGVILFSVGSLAQSHKMPAEALSVFREVFAQLPQRVIWKTEADIELLSENILLSKWLPQRDILAHKNVVAFITHAGLSGIYEALYSAVPMVLVPIFYDQMSNAAILEQLELGVNLDLSTVTTETLKNSLDMIINETRYRERAKEISILMKDQPLKYKETVVFWVEYVLRHNGTQHLETPASKIPLYQYLLLDVIGFLLAMLLGLCFGFYFLMKLFYKYFCWKSPFDTKKRQ